jgi:hypothetical protein
MMERGLKSAGADAATAVFLAAGAARSAALAIRANLEGEPAGSEAGEVVEAADARLAAVEEAERLAARLLRRQPG